MGRRAPLVQADERAEPGHVPEARPAGLEAADRERGAGREAGAAVPQTGTGKRVDQYFELSCVQRTVFFIQEKNKKQMGE